jgi:hypothetical protein
MKRDISFFLCGKKKADIFENNLQIYQILP